MKWDTNILQFSTNMFYIVIVTPVSIVKPKPAFFKNLYNLIECPVE